MIKVLAILIALLLLLVITSSMILYWWGLSNLNKNPIPSTLQITEDQKEVLWVKLNEIGKPLVKPISPYGYLMYFQCEVAKGLNRKICASKYPGVKIAAQSIRNQVRSKLGDRPSNLKWQSTWLAYTIWVMKNWNTDQIITTYYEAINT